MKKEKIFKVTRFHEEKGFGCVSETIISANSLKEAMKKALEENNISIEEMVSFLENK